MEIVIPVLSLLTALIVLWTAYKAAQAVKLAAKAAAIAQETKTNVQQLSITVDGRLTQLLEVTKVAAFGEGKAEGKAEERSGNSAPSSNDPPTPTPTPTPNEGA